MNVAATGLFSDKNAGAGKTVNLSSSYSGADVGNYVITNQATTTASISQANLTVTVSGVDKVYDGTTAATVAYADNRLGSDVLSITGAASFADKNAGTGKAVDVSGIAIGGSDAGNYNLLNTTAVTTASITPIALTVRANDDNRLVGTPYAGGNGVSYNGFVAGETSAVLNGALAYGGSSQGANAAGSYAITPGGYSATNYTLAYVDGVLNIRLVNAGAAALGSTALTTAYDGALQAVAGIGGALGGGGGSGGVGGSSSGDAGALAAALAEAGNTGEDE